MSWLAGVALVVSVLAWWAFTPLPAADELAPARPVAPTNPPPGDAQGRVALDQSAFRAPLWIAPPPAPAPAPPPKPEPPLPPLKLQILAIAPDQDGTKALLYDPDTDKPIWVRAGQSIGSRKVERVTADAVELRDGTALRTLALRESKPAQTPLERALRGTGGVP